jgi:serine/threonine protein kinase
MGVDAGPVSYHTVSRSEYASAGIQCGVQDLYDLIVEEGYLDEERARKVFRQVVDALSLCHCRGVFHR